MIIQRFSVRQQRTWPPRVRPSFVWYWLGSEQVFKACNDRGWASRHAIIYKIHTNTWDYPENTKSMSALIEKLRLTIHSRCNRPECLRIITVQVVIQIRYLLNMRARWFECKLESYQIQYILAIAYR